MNCIFKYMQFYILEISEMSIKLISAISYKNLNPLHKIPWMMFCQNQILIWQRIFPVKDCVSQLSPVRS